MIFCRSTTNKHDLHRQSLNWHFSLWPFNSQLMPWQRHLAHFGTLCDSPESDMASVFVSLVTGLVCIPLKVKQRIILILNPVSVARNANLNYIFLGNLKNLALCLFLLQVSTFCDPVPVFQRFERLTIITRQNMIASLYFLRVIPSMFDITSKYLIKLQIWYHSLKTSNIISAL